jgi:alpha-1,2-mannosyltransferase
MAAVALDCLAVKPRWPRGLLVGIAAVTKLTPAAFVLYFLIRRDWKAAATAAVTAALAVAGGFLLFPGTSSRYWFHTIAETGRIGSPHYVGNQSLKGTVFRLGLSDSYATAVWLLLALAAIAAGAAVMRRLVAVETAAAHDPGIDAAPTGLMPVTALLVNAAVLLLISPVSWTHHWVWIGPALITAVVWANPRRRALPFAVIGAFAVLFLIGPGLVPNGGDRELRWSWWQHIPGEDYVIATTALLVAALLRLRRLVPPAPGGLGSHVRTRVAEAGAADLESPPRTSPPRHPFED